VLGLKSQLTKTEAREKLASEIVRLTGRTTEEGTVKNGIVSFGWFVRNRFLPLKEADWRVETAKIKKYLIQADLLDEFEEIRMENFDKFALQSHLNRLARTRSRDRVLQIRSYMRAIFTECVQAAWHGGKGKSCPANLFDKPGDCPKSQTMEKEIGSEYSAD
jgi:hypothetical protein